MKEVGGVLSASHDINFPEVTRPNAEATLVGFRLFLTEGSRVPIYSINVDPIRLTMGTTLHANLNISNLDLKNQLLNLSHD
jgi:hypothetical protein